MRLHQCDTPSRLSTLTKVSHKIRMSNHRDWRCRYAAKAAAPDASMKCPLLTNSFEKLASSPSEEIARCHYTLGRSRSSILGRSNNPLFAVESTTNLIIEFSTELTGSRRLYHLKSFTRRATAHDKTCTSCHFHTGTAHSDAPWGTQLGARQST